MQQGCSNRSAPGVLQALLQQWQVSPVARKAFAVPPSRKLKWLTQILLWEGITSQCSGFGRKDKEKKLQNQGLNIRHAVRIPSHQLLDPLSEGKTDTEIPAAVAEFPSLCPRFLLFWERGRQRANHAPKTPERTAMLCSTCWEPEGKGKAISNKAKKSLSWFRN